MADRDAEQADCLDVAIQRAVTETLRLVADWYSDKRDVLRETADEVEQDKALAWSYSCPMCQEGICDEGCPLAPIRAGRGGR